MIVTMHSYKTKGVALTTLSQKRGLPLPLCRIPHHNTGHTHALHTLCVDLLIILVYATSIERTETLV